MGTSSETSYVVGDWLFFPRSHELARNGARIRLEHRTSALLEFMCERRGAVVSRDALIAHLWGRRHVSANSLPTAVHDLRRALGDDAKRPVYLETVSKGGYRLIAPEVTSSKNVLGSGVTLPQRRHFSLTTITVSVLIALSALAVIAASKFGAPTPLIVAVGEVANATTDPAYDSLARAADGVLLAALSEQPGIRVIRSRAEACRRCDIRFTARLVLWSGLPDVVMVAEAAESAEVVWSGFAFGPEASLPGKIRDRVGQFGAASRDHFGTLQSQSANAVDDGADG